MDATGRFKTLVQGPEPAIPLDEVSLLVAAHAVPDLDVGAWMRELDVIAGRCRDASFEGVLAHMASEGFTGNQAEYYDPRNSYLHAVIARRTGIPITLSIVTMEIGRRIGVPISGVGLPGHFVVRDANDSDAFADPFSGVILDRSGCLRLVEQAGAPDASDGDWLAPVGARAIVARLLANLKGVHLARRDRRALAWVLELRVAVPGVPLDEHRELASALASDGRFLDAASVLDRLADAGRAVGDPRIVEDAERGAVRLRARLN